MPLEAAFSILAYTTYATILGTYYVAAVRGKIAFSMSLSHYYMDKWRRLGKTREEVYSVFPPIPLKMLWQRYNDEYMHHFDVYTILGLIVIYGLGYTILYRIPFVVGYIITGAATVFVRMIWYTGIIIHRIYNHVWKHVKRAGKGISKMLYK